MIRRLARVLVRAGITLAMVAVLNFVLFRLAPGDPSRLLLSGARVAVSAEQLAAQRERWGLDRPLFPDQVVDYLTSTVEGDLGYSFKYRGERVTDLLLERLPATILLVGTAQLVSIVLGVLLGAWAGWRRGRPIDRLATTGSLVLYSTPYFWLGMILVLLFSTGLRLFPPNGLVTPGATYPDPWSQVLDIASHAVLPIATVALGLLGQYVLVSRAAISDVLTEDYMVTARAKGLTGLQRFLRHAFRNASLPITTLVTVHLGFIVGGTITAEAVFAWPGIGGLTVEALAARDYPVLEGIFLLLGTAIVGANLLADLVYGFLDPRVRR